MASIAPDPLFGRILDEIGRVKRKNTPGTNNGGYAHSKKPRGLLHHVAAIARRTPEVMVKVSGSARGIQHVREHLSYITRNGKLIAEDERGQLLVGRDSVQALAYEWQHADQGSRRANSKDTMNLVLSMPPGTNREALQKAVRQFASNNFGADRRYAFARHDDTKHPHCHLTLRAVGYDGRRLNPRKADLQAWRESFAQCLRDNGVAAEATPRKSRGVVRKSKRQAVLHAEKRGASTVARSKARQAVHRVMDKAPTERPWEPAIQERQKFVRSGWLEVANALEACGLQAATVLAVQVKKFVQGMPPAQTEQQLLVAQVNHQLSKQRIAETKQDLSQER